MNKYKRINYSFDIFKTFKTWKMTTNKKKTDEQHMPSKFET